MMRQDGMGPNNGQHNVPKLSNQMMPQGQKWTGTYRQGQMPPQGQPPQQPSGKCSTNKTPNGGAQAQ